DNRLATSALGLGGDVPVSFGKILQITRKEAGLSQSQLAAKAGVPLDSLRNWEQDRVLPRIDAAARLARALGVSLDALAPGEAGEQPAAPAAAPRAPATKKRPKKGED